MTKEVIWNWPNDKEPVMQIFLDGEVRCYENLSVMDYEDIMKQMAKDLSIAFSKTVEISNSLDKFFQDTAKIKSV